MGLETGTYINSLVATNPTSDDPRSQGDDHLRLIKATLKATFPNITGAVTVTHTEINKLAGVTGAVLDVPSLAALPAAIGTTTPVAGTFTNLAATVDLTLGGVTVALSTRNITAGTGLTGGGNLTADRTIALDTSNARNVDHSAVSISPGTGMTGGGTLESTRTLGLDTSNARNVDHSAVSISAGTGLTGGGTLASNRTLALDTSNARNVDHSAVSVIAGVGLTGGGTLESSRTLDINFANQAQAEAGTITNQAMSPLRVFQAIAASPNRIKAWVNFDANPSVSVRGTAHNVSSVSDLGAGLFRVNFTTAMADANYAAVANYTRTNASGGAFNDGQASCFSYSTTSVSVNVANGDGVQEDPEYCSVVVIA